MRNHIVSAIFHVLFETETYLEEIRRSRGPPPNLDGTLLEEIQDTSLMILRGMCTGHNFARQAQSETMAKRATPDILLKKLTQRRVGLLRKTLRVKALWRFLNFLFFKFVFRFFVSLQNSTQIYLVSAKVGIKTGTLMAV